MSPEFRQVGNLQQIALRTSPIAILATGQILVILTAGIDLSVGSVAALSGVVAGIVMVDAGLPVPVGVLAGCLTGLACGVANGLFVTQGRIPPFIVTLGMMMIARGLAMLISGAVPIHGLPASLKYLGGSQKVFGLGGWWIPVSLALVIATLFAVTLSFTRFGRALYATGGNLVGARLSGVAVDKVRVVAYALCGLMAGIGGVVIAARASIAHPMAAPMYELDSIAACVIGGASLMGGEGGVMGVLAGALIMNVLVNFCNLNDVSVHWQPVIVGSLIIVLVYYDSLRKRRAGLLKEWY